MQQQRRPRKSTSFTVNGKKFINFFKIHVPQYNKLKEKNNTPLSEFELKETS